MKVDSKSHVVQGRIFGIHTQRTKSGPQLRLIVNFNTDNISLYKEVRYYYNNYHQLLTMYLLRHVIFVLWDLGYHSVYPVFLHKLINYTLMQSV